MAHVIIQRLEIYNLQCRLAAEDQGGVNVSVLSAEDFLFEWGLFRPLTNEKKSIHSMEDNLLFLFYCVKC